MDGRAFSYQLSYIFKSWLKSIFTIFLSKYICYGATYMRPLPDDVNDPSNQHVKRNQTIDFYKLGHAQ